MPDRIIYEFTCQGLESGQSLSVIDFKGFEAISRLYEFTINLKSESPDIDMDAMLSAPCTLRMRIGGYERPVHGVLSDFEQLHQVDKFTFYRAVLVPKLWQLSLYQANEIYLNDQADKPGTDVPEILGFILKECGLNKDIDYRMTLNSTYPKHPYRCQWNETHLNYISRLMEHEGIYYYFEQGDDRERIVFCDLRQGHSPVENPDVNYSPVAGLDIDEAVNNIHALVCRQKRMPITVILKDYNYEKPSLDVTGKAEVDPNGIGEVFRYGDNFDTPEEGHRLAGIRAQEIYTNKERYFGESMVSRLVPGHLFTMQGHYRETFNREYLVTEIRHEGAAPSYLADRGEGEPMSAYHNSFTAIPSTVQFRPERRTEKPRFHGQINAVVDGEASGKYAELDDQGRYKIRLPFDRENSHGQGKASYWFRKAEPHAGPNEGMHFPLRQKTEVLLSFIDGDPDRPVISSAIANPASPNVVTGKNQTNNVIRTSAGNLIDMEDTEESKRIKMFSPEANSYLHLGAPNHEGRGIVMLTQGIYRSEIGGGYQVTLATEPEYKKAVVGHEMGSSVEWIRVDEGGSGYTANVTVTLEGGGGSGATATAIVDSAADQVAEISVKEPGSGYAGAPEVTVTTADGDNGPGAEAVAEIASGEVVAIRVTSCGSGYTSAPTVEIDPPSPITATAFAELGTGEVTEIQVTNAGSGYTSAPSVSFSGGGGSGAMAEASISPAGQILGIHMFNGGIGYTSPPSVSFSGGGSGSGATAEASVSPADQVVRIMITNNGGGYGEVPAISISGASGSGAAASAEVAYGEVVAIEVTNGGSDYTDSPTVTIDAPQTEQANAESELGIGEIVAVRVDSGGSGYTTAPTVSFEPDEGSSGSGATATAFLGDVAIGDEDAITGSDMDGQSDVFTAEMIKEIHPFHKRDPEWGNIDKENDQNVELNPQFDEQEKSEIRGDYIILRSLGEHYTYTKGNQYSFHHPKNKEFTFGNSFTVNHWKEDGYLNDSSNPKALMEDLVGAERGYNPNGVKTYYGQTPAGANDDEKWNAIINNARVSLSEYDTITGQKGNIYDFGGYWNYNLGNSYEEAHIDQQAELNANHQIQWPGDDKLGNEGGKIAAGIMKGAAAVASGPIGIIAGALTLGLQMGLSESPKKRNVGDVFEEGGPNAGEIKTDEAKVTKTLPDDEKNTENLTTDNTWVTKQFGNTYDFMEGQSIDIRIGDQEEHSRGNTYEYTYGGTHEETMISGIGIKTSWEKSGGGQHWEQHWDPITGEFLSYEYKNRGYFSFELQLPKFLPTLSISLSLENLKTSLSISAGAKLDISASASASSDISVSAGIKGNIDIGASVAWTLKGHVGGEMTYNLATMKWDGEFMGFRAQKDAAIAADNRQLVLKTLTTKIIDNGVTLLNAKGEIYQRNLTSYIGQMFNL